MKATKGNKVYTIDETQKAGYIAQGFDITDDTGQIIAYGRGKTVPYGDYVALLEHSQRMEKRIAELDEQLQKRIAELEGVAQAEKKGKAGQKAGE